VMPKKMSPLPSRSSRIHVNQSIRPTLAQLARATQGQTKKAKLKERLKCPDARTEQQFAEFEAACEVEVAAGNKRARAPRGAVYSGGCLVCTDPPAMSMQSYKRRLANMIARRCGAKDWRIGEVRIWLRRLGFRPGEIRTIMWNAWK
jgi:hypothetical protein